MAAAPANSLGRKLIILIGCLLLAIAGFCGLLFVSQHSLIYHPRPYLQSYLRSLPSKNVTIEYRLDGLAQTAYYIPSKESTPRRLWIAFCGNGSLALDWTYFLEAYPNPGDAFLLIDYPGYGRNGGYATSKNTRESVEIALHVLAEQLHVTEGDINLAVIGHSLGAAAALDFAAHHKISRAIIVAPFTTLREEAARVVGWPLAYLVRDNYDNRSCLGEILKDQPNCGVTIFHGTEDEVIPVTMGRILAKKYPRVRFFEVQGAGHDTVMEMAKPEIFAAMTP
jgi:pimeloyl-ACP methyl ester carboxylesterase